MAIKLDTTTYLNTGLSFAKEGKIISALSMFNKTPTYEGKLNRAIMLANMGDILSVFSAYCRLYAEYGATHNVFSDVKKLNILRPSIMQSIFADNKPKKYDKRKKSAKKQLLATVNSDRNDDYDDYFDMEGQYEELLGGSDRQFYDLNSEEYQDMLFEKYVTSGKSVVNRHDFKRRLLEMDSDYQPTLQFQLGMFLEAGEREKAAIAAERLFSIDFTQTALLQLLDYYSNIAPDKAKCVELFNKVLSDVSAYYVYDLDVCMATAIDFVRDTKYAAFFAAAINSAGVNLPYATGIAVAQVYYLRRDYQRMFEYMIEIRTVFGSNTYIDTIIDNFKCILDADETDCVLLGDVAERHFGFYDCICQHLISQLRAIAKKNKKKIHAIASVEIKMLSSLLYHLSATMSDESRVNMYNEVFSCVCDTLQSVTVKYDEREAFFIVAREYMCQFANEPAIAIMLVMQLMEACAPPVYYRDAFHDYFIDVGLIEKYSKKDEKLQFILGIIAVAGTLTDKSAAEYVVSYKTLHQCFPEEAEKATPMQIAYVLLNLVESTEYASKALAFVDEDKQFYDFFKQQMEE